MGIFARLIFFHRPSRSTRYVPRAASSVRVLDMKMVPKVSSRPEGRTPRRPKIEHEVVTRFSRACDGLEPIKSGAELVLGCSAGGDSMALLDLMTEQAAQRKWRLAVVHFDHAQRTESEEESRFVEDRCAALGLDFIGGKMEISENKW